MPPLAEIFKNRLQKNVSEVALVELTLPFGKWVDHMIFSGPFWLYRSVMRSLYFMLCYCIKASKQSCTWC